MDFDVIIIGSGFGGAITACRLAEAGCKVLVLERGRRWSRDLSSAHGFPREPTDPWIWDHKRPDQCNGWIDLRTFPNMAVVQGAGVGGGSLIYANVSVEAPPQAFDEGWPPEVTFQELKPYYDRVAEFMNVRPLPTSQWNPRTRLMKEAAEKLGYGDRFRLVDLAVNFSDDLTLDPDNPPDRTQIPLVENQHGVKQGTCHHCGECDIGCDVNARNTLDTNYIPVAETHAADVRSLHLVTRIEPYRTGYKVFFRQLGNGRRQQECHTADKVILAAGSLGSTELLLQARDGYGTLPNISPMLGRDWSSNGDFLTPALYASRMISPGCGPTITSAIDFHDRSVDKQAFWIQDGGFPDFMARHLRKLDTEAAKQFGIGFLLSSVNQLLQKLNPGGHIMPWFAQAVDAGNGVLSLKRCCWFFGKKRLHLKWDVAKSRPAINAVAEMHKRLSDATGGIPIPLPGWALSEDLVTPHPLGGCNIGNSPENGVVKHTGEVFGYDNLYVADGAVIPRAIGVNPSRTIAALAERTSEFIIESKRSET